MKPGHLQVTLFLKEQLALSLSLLIMSRTFSDHHLRYGGWLNFEFRKRGKHLGRAIKLLI